MRILLRDGRVEVNKGMESGQTPRNVACWLGKEEVVKIRLRDERVEVNKVDRDGSTPLYIACGWGKEAIVKVLLASGCSEEDHPWK